MNQEIVRKFIEEPDTCPCCDSILTKIGDQLFCKNTECTAQVFKKIEHFSKVVGIKGLGPKTVEKLNLKSSIDLFYLSKEQLAAALGEKLGNKLLDEITRAFSNISIATYIEASSIPLVGKVASEKISNIIDSIEEITLETCKKAGLGDKVSQNLVTWVQTEFNNNLPFSFNNNKISYAADNNYKTVCITGKLKSFKKKADVANLLFAAGYRLVESVTKQLDFLVDETGSSSSKREKAVQYGITIITDINELIKVDND